MHGARLHRNQVAKFSLHELDDARSVQLVARNPISCRCMNPVDVCSFHVIL